jgi:hypothetical protein
MQMCGSWLLSIGNVGIDVRLVQMQMMSQSTAIKRSRKLAAVRLKGKRAANVSKSELNVRYRYRLCGRGSLDGFVHAGKKNEGGVLPSIQLKQIP